MTQLLGLLRVGTLLVEKGSHHSHFKTFGWTAPPHSEQPNYLFRGFSWVLFIAFTQQLIQLGKYVTFIIIILYADYIFVHLKNLYG